jgi:hypothetical protein
VTPDERFDSLEVQLGALARQVDATIVRTDSIEQNLAYERGRVDNEVARNNRLEVRADVDSAVLAQLRAEGVLAQEHSVQLEEALKSSRLIGAAIGIVMVNLKITEDKAFAVLRTVSQNTNQRLVDVARLTVMTGETPSRVQ